MPANQLLVQSAMAVITMCETESAFEDLAIGLPAWCWACDAGCILAIAFCWWATRALYRGQPLSGASAHI